MLYHTNGVVYGLPLGVDHACAVAAPGLWLLVALSLIVAAALCFANVSQHGVRLPVIAFVMVFAPSLLLQLHGTGHREAVGQAG